MIRLLRAFEVFRRVFPSRNIPEWTTADAKGVEAFLGSYTGRKLLAHLDRHLAQANKAAVEMRGDPFEAGTAFGQGVMLSWLIQFSAQTPESQTGTDEVASDLEHFAP